MCFPSRFRRCESVCGTFFVGPLSVATPCGDLSKWNADAFGSCRGATAAALLAGQCARTGERDSACVDTFQRQNLTPGHISLESVTDSTGLMPVSLGEQSQRQSRSHEEQVILDTLREGNGSRKNAAEKLGISQRTLRYKIARMRDAGGNTRLIQIGSLAKRKYRLGGWRRRARPERWDNSHFAVIQSESGPRPPHLTGHVICRISLTYHSGA